MSAYPHCSTRSKRVDADHAQRPWPHAHHQLGHTLASTLQTNSRHIQSRNGLKMMRGIAALTKSLPLPQGGLVLPAPTLDKLPRQLQNLYLGQVSTILLLRLRSHIPTFMPQAHIPRRQTSPQKLDGRSSQKPLNDKAQTFKVLKS